MLNKIRELRLARNEEGFTLIELMITVVVIGILSAIAIPIFANQQKAAADAVVKSDLKNVALAFQTFAAREGHVATTGNDMNALKIKLSPRDNYGTTVNYFLVCTNGINYALYAKSVSGNSFVYSSATGKLQEDNNFPRTGASACPDAGITNPEWFWSQDSNLVSH